MPSLSLSPYPYEMRYFALTKLELQKKDIVPTLETISLKRLRTLYVTGEESAKQVKLRAERLAAGMGAGASDFSNCLIYSETLMENVITEARALMPDLMVVDSVQTMYSQAVESSPGSVSQIKETAAMLLRFAKETGVPVILIGHITKEGSIAGPKILEHIVDVVLQFEGTRG